MNTFLKGWLVRTREARLWGSSDSPILESSSFGSLRIDITAVDISMAEYERWWLMMFLRCMVVIRYTQASAFRVHSPRTTVKNNARCRDYAPVI